MTNQHTTTENPILAKNQDNNYYNRTVTLGLQCVPNSSHYYIDIFLNKNNNLFNFNYDLLPGYEINVIRNLDNSFFVKKYLNIQSVLDSHTTIRIGPNKGTKIKLDGRCILNGKGDPKLDTCYKFMSEKLTFGKDNNLTYIGYGIKDHKDDYSFIYVTRTKFYKNTNTQKWRTAGIEIRRIDSSLDLGD